MRFLGSNDIPLELPRPSQISQTMSSDFAFRAGTRVVPLYEYLRGTTLVPGSEYNSVYFQQCPIARASFLHLTRSRYNRPVYTLKLRLPAMIAEQQSAKRESEGVTTFIQNQFSDSVIENINVWLNVLDEQLNIVLWNATAEKLSGYRREEVLGHAKIWDWLYPDEAYRHKIVVATSAMISTQHELENFETKILCKDGQIKTMSWNARRLVNEQGELQGAINFGYDITERRRAREALQKAHNELSVLYEIASIASSSPELNTILERSLERVLPTMRSNKGMVHLLDDDSQTLHLTAQQGLSNSVISQIEAVALDSDLIGRVFERGEPMMVPNLATELSNLKSVPANLLHSYLGAPVRAKGKVLGVFSVFGKGGNFLVQMS